jgi:hypothetical protein
VKASDFDRIGRRLGASGNRRTALLGAASLALAAFAGQPTLSAADVRKVKRAFRKHNKHRAVVNGESWTRRCVDASTCFNTNTGKCWDYASNPCTYWCNNTVQGTLKAYYRCVLIRSDGLRLCDTGSAACAYRCLYC